MDTSSIGHELNLTGRPKHRTFFIVRQRISRPGETRWAVFCFGRRSRGQNVYLSSEAARLQNVFPLFDSPISPSSLPAHGKREASPVGEAIQLWRGRDAGWLRREGLPAMTGLRLQVF